MFSGKMLLTLQQTFDLIDNNLKNDDTIFKRKVRAESET
jgi:hypothetical protein